MSGASRPLGMTPNMIKQASPERFERMAANLKLPSNYAPCPGSSIADALSLSALCLRSADTIPAWVLKFKQSMLRVCAWYQGLTVWNGTNMTKLVSTHIW